MSRGEGCECAKERKLSEEENEKGLLKPRQSPNTGKATGEGERFMQNELNFEERIGVVGLYDARRLKAQRQQTLAAKQAQKRERNR